MQGGVRNASSKSPRDLHPAGFEVRKASKHVVWQTLTRSREGDKIVLEGEADQVPDQEPGNIVFTLVQTEHNIFRRAGADLLADIDVTLAEALCGFSRVVIKHLDGRGLNIQHPQSTARVLEPGQVIKVEGEGMPYKKSDMKGDLYLLVKIKFPSHEWLVEHQAIPKLRELLPEPDTVVEAEVIDDVTYDEEANLDDFGAGAEGDNWVDDDGDEEADGPQCAQQ